MGTHQLDTTSSLQQEGIGNYLDALHTAARASAEKAVEGHRSSLGTVHQLDHDIGQWLSSVNGPESDQLRTARRELALAEFCAASGLYRQAFASLRLFLELSFAAVHFSVNEFERRRWMSDKTDFSWSQALDRETGVLSKQFVAEFAPTVQGEAAKFAENAASTYRYCSQFIHGKAIVASSIPETVEYSADAVSTWCQHALSSGNAVLFLLYVRYGADLDAHSDPSLSEILINRFGHLTAVRSLLELAND